MLIPLVRNDRPEYRTFSVATGIQMRVSAWPVSRYGRDQQGHSLSSVTPCTPGWITTDDSVRREKSGQEETANRLPGG